PGRAALAPAPDRRRPAAPAQGLRHGAAAGHLAALRPGPSPRLSRIEQPRQYRAVPAARLRDHGDDPGGVVAARDPDAARRALTAGTGADRAGIAGASSKP